MNETVKMFNADQTPVYVAGDCVPTFLKAGYRIADKAEAQTPKNDRPESAADKSKTPKKSKKA